MANYDSLLIGGHIECIGPGGAAGTTPSMGTPSTDPNFPGVVFSLQPGYGLGEPQPTVDLLAPLLFDGERPWGRRASNRTIQLPIYIIAPVDAGDPTGNWSYLAAAVESLMYTCDADTFQIIWTRHQGGDPQPLPLVFDCFRAAPATVVWGGLDESLHSAIASVTLNITALPYGRSDVATVIDFQNPLTGVNAPPAPVQLDSFAAVGAAGWLPAPLSPSGSGTSAYWDPAVPVWQQIFYGNGSTAGPYIQATMSQVNVGQSYTQQAWFMSPQGWASGVAIDIQWYGVSGFLSQTTGATVALTAGVPALATVTGTAPASATYAVMSLAANGTPPATTVFLVCGGPPSPSSLQPESGFAGFDGAGTAYLAQYGATTGTPASQWTLAFVGNGAVANPKAGGPKVPVVPGQSCAAAAWAMSPQGWPTGVVLGIDFYTSGGGYISSAVSPLTGAPAGQPILLTCSGPAPATAASMAFSVEMNGTPPTSVFLNVAGGPALGSSPTTAPVTTFTATNSASITVYGTWANNPQFLNGAGASALYYNTDLNLGAGFNIAGEQALTFWAGFGSSLYFPHWCKKGGLVNFAITLTDNNGATLAFSRVQKCYGSNSAIAPKWNKIRVSLPRSATFNFASVAVLQLVVTNYAADLRYTRVYLSDIEAVPPPLPAAVQPNYGQVYDLGQVQGSARSTMALQAQLAGTSTQTRTFSIAGAGQWTCPAGVTSVNVYAVGGGGGGGFGTSAAAGGAGGGGTSTVTSVAVTAGNVYNLVAGFPGQPGTTGHTAGGAGGASSFTGDSVTVTAPGGAGSAGGSSTAGGAGGAAGSGGFAGGTGGAGTTGTGGGGGGSSGGTAAAGNTGQTGTAGGAGGAAVTGGGAGGHGATLSSIGGTGAQPGGGGGGGYGTNHPPGNWGSAGYVVLTYAGPGAMETLIAHRPGFYASPELVPFVPVPTGDTPNGATQYPVPQFTPGVNARFGTPVTGTFSVIAVPWSWSGGGTSSSARTITVTVTQYEQVGGASYTTSAVASITPSTLPQLSNPNAKTGFARLGEITLPPNLLPSDNLDCYFTVSVTSSNTSDRFQDILFLDTMGSTVIVESPTAYQQMFIDEPDVNASLGNVLGTLYDRADAVSVMDRATISGGPLDVDPYGNRTLLIYSMEGNPLVEVTYFAHYFLERSLQ